MRNAFALMVGMALVAGVAQAAQTPVVSASTIGEETVRQLMNSMKPAGQQMAEADTYAPEAAAMKPAAGTTEKKVTKKSVKKGHKKGAKGKKGHTAHADHGKVAMPASPGASAAPAVSPTKMGGIEPVWKRRNVRSGPNF